MRILGIDPGYAIVGVGVIEYNGHSFKTLEYGRHYDAGRHCVSGAAADDLQPDAGDPGPL